MVVLFFGWVFQISSLMYQNAKFKFTWNKHCRNWAWSWVSGGQAMTHTDILCGYSHADIICHLYHMLIYILTFILLNADVVTSTILFIWIRTKKTRKIGVIWWRRSLALFNPRCSTRAQKNGDPWNFSVCVLATIWMSTQRNLCRPYQSQCIEWDALTNHCCAHCLWQNFVLFWWAFFLNHMVLFNKLITTIRL